jgi:hypothetical protein
MRALALFSICVPALAFGLPACGGQGNNNTSGSGGGAGAGGGTGTSTGTLPDVPYAACGGAIFDAKTGALDEKEYRRQARLWDKATIDCRLGPKYADLHATPEQFPTAWEPEHKPGMGYLCKKSYELSGTCNGACDYGSTSGQVLYAPDSTSEPGVDRVQTYGYENGTICESPQAGDWLGGPHPDPAVVQWAKELGHPVLWPNAFHQTELYETNGGILTFPDGLVGATGNQTSGGSNPKIVLPQNKVPTSVAVTGYNEFALVTIWDTDALKGQVAVFALRADSPEAFSVPYFALPNEAGFKNIHLMGYVDLPDMVAPTSITAIGNNGGTPGGHVIGFEFGNKNDPTKNIATSDAARSAFARDDSERWVASSGQAVVASRWENKITFLDLRPLFQFVRNAYFGSKDQLDKSVGQDTWAYTFETSPEAMPAVVTTLPMKEPTVLRAGNMLSPFADGLQKSLHAFVANVDGEVHLFDISGFDRDAPRPIPASSVKEIAMVQAGKNITGMRKSGHANTSVIVASRGDRAVQWLEVQKDGFVIARTFRDSRMADPVVVDPNDRGPIVTVGDFASSKLLNYRVGRTENNGGKPPADYGCGKDGADTDCKDGEFGGELSLPGAVYYVGTTNVN